MDDEDLRESLVWVAETVIGRTPEELAVLGSTPASNDWTPKQWTLYAGVLGGAVLRLADEKRELEKENEKLRRGR